MKMPWSNRQGPMKLLAVCATGLLAALGMCGLQGAVFWGFFRPLPKGGDVLIVSMIVLGYVELGVGILSIAGIVIALLAALQDDRLEFRKAFAMNRRARTFVVSEDAR